MTSESSEIKPPKEGKPLEMNNFYFNLPGGYYREFKGEEGAEEKTKIMEAIDQLLATDFSHLDATRIYRSLVEANRAKTEAVNSRRYQTHEELVAAIRPQLEAARQAQEELRPLFNKLVEMGFDSRQLAQ